MTSPSRVSVDRLHERIDESDVVLPPDNEGVHIKGHGLRAHHAREENRSARVEKNLAARRWLMTWQNLLGAIPVLASARG